MLTAVLVSCGSGSTGGHVATRDVPTGADTVVFRVDTRGGYTSAEYQMGIVPAVTLYGDGRVVMTGPTTEQYPPHALPNLLTGTLSRADVERLAERAADLGLLRPADYGQPAVTDLPTTTVTIAVDGTHEHAAYAFDFGTNDTPGLTAEQRNARDRLRRFTSDFGAAADGAATEPYAPTEVAVFVRPATATGDASGVDPGRADWPLAGDLATMGSPYPNEPNINPAYRCAVLTGDDTRTALAAAADATSITRWRSHGADYSVTWRPLLPDEHTCPGGP